MVYCVLVVVGCLCVGYCCSPLFVVVACCLLLLVVVSVFCGGCSLVVVGRSWSLFSVRCLWVAVRGCSMFVVCCCLIVVG